MNRSPEHFGYDPEKVRYFTTAEGQEIWVPLYQLVPESYELSTREAFEAAVAEENEKILEAASPEVRVAVQSWLGG